MAKISFRVGFFFVIVLIASVIVPSSITVSWIEEKYRLTEHTHFDGLPSITETSDGRIWIVWAKAVLGANVLFYKTSSDLGTTWSEEQNLTYISGVISSRHDTSPSIIQAADGTIWLVWASNRPPPPPSEPGFSVNAVPESLTISQGGSCNTTIIVTSLLNFSEQVGLEAKTTPSGISSLFHPNEVTPPPNGSANSTLTVSANATAEIGNHTLTILGKTENKSRFVNIPLEITNPTTATLSEPVSSTSASSAENEMDYEIYYKTSNDDGATWSSAIRLTDHTGDDLSPSIVQLVNGTILVAWQSVESGNSDIYCRTTSDGVSWSDAAQLTTHAGLDKGPAVMQTEDGKIWLAWYSMRTGDYEIYCKTYDESSWTDVVQLTVSPNSDTNPSITQTLDKGIWIFWSTTEDALNADADIYYMNSSDNGETWSDSIQFIADSNEDTWPAVTQSRDGRIWVVWTSDRDENWDIYYRFSDEMVIHDVAVTHVEPATSTAKIGDLIAIAVTAENQGTEEESVEVTCYASSTLIASPNMTSLNAGDSHTAYFTWDTAGLGAGIYVMWANASRVEGEVDFDDNAFTDGTVELIEPIHDVALVDVTPALNVALQGQTIPISVTAQNQGTEVETFDVSCYANSTSIGSETISLNPADSTLLTFVWDTSDFAIGNYVISATASPVPDEDDTDDNAFIDGTIEVVAQPVHDIAVIGVTPSTTTASIGQSVSIAVTVKNEGTETETFNITTKYNDTEIGTQTVTSLPSGEKTTETFVWNIIGVLSGNYTISAQASFIPSEADTADNTFIYGEITVLPYRDVAVTNVIASPTEVTKPGTVSINVTVLNEGELTETVNVTTYYDNVEIDFTQIDIILTAGANETLTFIWNTTATDEGSYTICAKISEVPNETDLDDNTFVNGEVTVTRPPGVPVAAFTWSPVEPLVNEIITYDASVSYDPDGGNGTYPSGIVSYEWDFGDSTAGTSMITSHTYSAIGRYRVTLTVEDIDAKTDSVMRIVAIYRRDVAIVDVAAYPAKAVVGDLVTVNVTALNEGGLPETFDITVYYQATKIESQTVNNLLPGANTTLTFVWNTTGLTTGEYVLKAEASLVSGETDVADNSFTNGLVALGRLPSAMFDYSPSTPLVGETIIFNATGSKPNGGVITLYMWDFGDDLTGWGVILEHTYASLRIYEVRLTITDSEGLTNSMTRNVTVHPAPIASFTYTPSLPNVGEVVTFNGSASYSPEESALVGYAWSFGDGTNGIGMIEAHIYTNSGTYVVMLTVEDVVGNEDSDSMTITVAEAPSPASPWTLEILGFVTAIVTLGSVLTLLFFRKRTANAKS